MAARWWMTSAFVDQTKEASLGGRALNWSERKITRVHGTSDTNGTIAVLSLEEQSKNANHIHAERASTESVNNPHLLIRDEYREVIHAEKAPESDTTYNVPSIRPEIMVWARKLV